MTAAGFPHSDIRGSILICSSPRLFAAYRVLRRLMAPRHPPYALSSLISLALLRHLYAFDSLISLLLALASIQRSLPRGSSPAGKRLFSSLLFSFQGPKSGGDEENRTPDPLLARQVLSQLSYAPGFPLLSAVILWWA